jgi:hypothetical protein
MSSKEALSLKVGVMVLGVEGEVDQNAAWFLFMVL